MQKKTLDVMSEKWEISRKRIRNYNSMTKIFTRVWEKDKVRKIKTAKNREYKERKEEGE
jgi:hypothetical protein